MQEGAICTARARDQADDGAGDHALRLGASAGGAVAVRKLFLNLWDRPRDQPDGPDLRDAYVRGTRTWAAQVARQTDDEPDATSAALNEHSGIPGKAR